LKAVAFDLDAASLISLRDALPEWEIEVLTGAIVRSGELGEFVFLP
jgi:hypothetical protein